MGKTAEHPTGRAVTVVEVMMAIAILAIGATGVVSLQKIVLDTNQKARHLVVANEVAKTWMERLKMESILWNHPSSVNAASDLETDTQWLAKLANTDNSGWFRPVNSTVCGVHDVFGREQACGHGATVTGPYCVNLRLSWLRSTQDLILAEVRVYWITTNRGPNALAADLLPCGSAADPPDVVDLVNKGIARSIYTSAALIKNEVQ